MGETEKKHFFILGPSIYLDALLVTFLVFTFGWGFHHLESLFLNPTHNQIEDFEFTDRYFSMPSHEVGVDTNIIILDINPSVNKQQLAALIDTVAFLKPKVIGLDYFFNKSDTNGNSSLISSISRHTDVLVLADELDINHGVIGPSLRGELPFYVSFAISRPDDYSKLRIGYTNSFIENNLQRIRYAKPFTGIKDTSFAALIVRQYDKAIFENLANRKRTEKGEIINYMRSTNGRFNIYHDTFPVTDRKKIEGKILLLGTGSGHNNDDMHFTPLSPFFGRSFPDMSGIEIHAQIISMICRRNYLQEVEYSEVITFLICYVFVLFFLVFFIQREIYYHAFFEIVLIFIMAGIMAVTIIMMDKCHKKFESVPLIAHIFFAVNFLYIYQMLVYLLKDFPYFKSVVPYPHHKKSKK